jgi:hypothetical protein
MGIALLYPAYCHPYSRSPRFFLAHPTQPPLAPPLGVPDRCRRPATLAPHLHRPAQMCLRAHILPRCLHGSRAQRPMAKLLAAATMSTWTGRPAQIIAVVFFAVAHRSYSCRTVARSGLASLTTNPLTLRCRTCF